MSKTKNQLLSDEETLGVFTHPCDADYDYQIAKAQENKEKEGTTPPPKIVNNF